MRRFLLPLIFLLALVLRFWNLGSYPEAIDEDEMALGYYGYSLVKNGTDEYGNKFPVYFQSAGDYKYGLYSYLAAIPVWLFGLNPVTTRSVAALAGALSVIAIYFLALTIFNKKRYALIAAFVLAVAPTHIHFSRVAYNNILGALFATVAITFYLHFLKKFDKKNVLLALGFFVLSIYSYQAYRIFLPAVFILLALLLPTKNRLKAILVSLFAVAVVGLSFISPAGRARSQDFSILINKPKLIEQYTEDSLGETPLLLTRALHNKIAATSLGVLNRYFSYFDPKFLFVDTAQAERHTTPDMGLFYLIEAPLFLLGILFLLKIGKSMVIPLVLLLASPLAASLVIEARSTTRGIIIVYALSLIIALGIYFLTSIKKQAKFGVGLLALLYLANFIYFFHQYTVHKIYHHPWYSDVGLKEIVMRVNELYDGYDAVVMSNGHYIPYLFYNKVDPKVFIQKSEFADQALTRGVRVIRYDKIFFNMPYECPAAGKERVLYVCFGFRVPQNADLVDVIRFRDGQPAIVLVEFRPPKERISVKLPERVEYSKDIDSRFETGVLPEDYEYYWPVQ